MKKLIAKLLLVTMLVSNLPTNIYAAAPEEIKGQIDMTVNFKYPIKQDKVNGTGTGVFVKISEETKNEEKIYLKQELEVDAEEVSSINLSDLSVPQGDYTLSLEGVGYTNISQEFTVDKHNMNLQVDANAFLAGDINQDSKVNKDDISLLVSKVGTKSYSQEYDLNRDGKIDITDLTYIYFNQKADQVDSLNILRTTLIPQTVIDTTKLEEKLESETGVTIANGSIDDLFKDQDKIVTLKGKKPIEEEPMAIPVEFSEPVEMERVAISIGSENRPTALTLDVEVINEDGTTSIEKYDYAAPQETKVRGAYSTQNTINIDLGKKVPVKKVTIKVTKVEDETSSLVDIAKVEFLENVLENVQPPDKAIIRNLQVEPGDQELIVTWDQVNNVTGYKVEYGDASGQYTEFMTVSNNKAIIKNFKKEKLINYTPYYIVVTAINGGWQGETSEEVVGIPKPKSVPRPPDNPNAKPGNEKIYLTWKKTESASGYNVYYKVKTAKEYTKVAGITTTEYVVNELQNGIEYEIYVTAYNEIGESNPSTSVVCIPEKEDIKIPDVPTYNLINTPNGKTEGIKTDHITKVELVNKNNVNPEYPKDFDIADVVDGDYYTHWTGRAFWEDRGITVTFDKPYEMDYVAYVSRLDGRYKEALGYYSITIWESDDATPKKIVDNQKIPGYSKDGLAILPFEKATVKKITVETRQIDGAPTADKGVSASELKFYEYYSLNDDIKNVFANDIYTELAPEVTLEKINNLRNMVNGLDGRYYLDSEILLQELDMAEALLRGDTRKLGRVVNVYSGRSTHEDTKRGFAMGLNTDQPLGIVAKANEKLVVYVDAPVGKVLPDLVFTQYFAEPGNYKQSVSLTRGRNVIKVPNIGSYSTPKGGSVYIQGTDVEGMTIHIKGVENSKKEPSVVNIPQLTVLDLSIAKEAEIKEALKTYIEELEVHAKLYRHETDYRNTTEIETKNNLLSLPATKILEGIKSAGATIDEQVEQLWQALNAWEEIMILHYNTLGLFEDAIETYNQFPTSRMNTRYMRMFGKAFMYATSAHIGIGYNSVPDMMKGQSSLKGQTPSYFGWGIDHEIGHVLNYKSYVAAEVTNNIFALFAQEASGQDIRIKGKYPQIYEKVAVPTEGMAGDVFVSLGMYWQLHLAYDENKVMEKDDFYPRLHRAYRESNVPSGEEGFVILASEMAGKDLTDFFTHWGVKISQSTKDAIAAKGLSKEDKKIYYINDDAFDYRLAGGKGLTSTTVTMDAVITPPKEVDNNSQRVQIEMSVPEKDKEHILGYEISRNGEVIGFTTELSYTDIIGAANNRAFEYSVKVYDKLLNEVGTATAAEIKISYDGEISKDGWSVERTTTGGIIIDMQKVNAVAGIKFKNLLEEEHAYTVKVSQMNSGDGVRTTGPAIEVSKWMMAKDGVINGTNGLEYFNKPGAPSSDTRIWTYDARFIQIEGIENLMLDQIEILSYPGDNIEIRPGAIGKLGHDYVYGSGEDDVIKEGTVIVVGDYRGDAIYNIIKPRGVFEVGAHGEEKEETHVINGYGLMFAEVPEDGVVSTSSDGIWIYVPDKEPFVGALGESGSITENMTEEQKELLEETKAVLQRIKVELYRVDNLETLENERLVSDTSWIEVPMEGEMPIINLVKSK